MKKLLILSALFLLALPSTAQAAVPIQDPNDVSAETIDIKSSVVDYFVDGNGDGALAFTVESYEPFGCDDLSASRQTGQSLAFIFDFPSRPGSHDMRIRIRCNKAGVYRWVARLPQYDNIRVGRGVSSRPSDTTLVVDFTLDWYGAANGELPARYKVVSTRWANSVVAEIDTAPDRGWGDFGVQGSF